jgi:DNA polymerase-3 subunit gamma/tau
MSNYIVSARKYRPINFDSVVGQSALTTTLKNSIASGRLAHAYLFCGPRGVGKTTCARIFAKTINCLTPQPNGEACETCESCRAFNEQRSYNIHELDAASNNGVDDIRQLIEQVNIPPQIGRYKVFIIDEVHMLSSAAFNAFLKTLEEPPAHAIFILATTEKHKLLPTILSRCQIYDFNRMSVQDIVGHLEHVAAAENVTYEPAALHVIAQKADGGMRDALSIFDQVVSFCQGNITYQQTIADLNVLDYEYYFKLVDYFLAGDITNIMLTFNDILSKGFEGSHFIGGLNQHLRDLLVSRDAQTTALIETSEEVRQRYAEQAQRCQPKFLFRAIRKCTDCDLNYRTSQNKRLLVEITLIEIAQLSADDVPSSGPGPTKRLKPIFSAPAKDVAGTPAATAPQQPTTPSPAEQQPTAMPTTAPAVPAPERLTVAETPQPKPNRTRAQGFSLATSQNRNDADGTSAYPAIAAEDPSTLQSANGMTPSPAVADATLPLLPLDSNGIITAWRTYARNIKSTNGNLAVRMDYSQPVLADDKQSITVTVSNPLVEQIFQEGRRDILRYLCRQFQLPTFDMHIVLDENDTTNVVLTPSQQLSKLIEEYPDVALLSKQFGLELE